MAAVTVPTYTKLAVVVGGLGSSQMDDIARRLAQEPTCKVVSAGKWNGYQTNLPDLIRDNLPPGVTSASLVGHSMAGIPIIDCIADYRELVNYAALIDPVSSKDGVHSYRMPQDRPAFLWCRRSQIGFEARIGIELPLDIADAGEPEVIEGSHNQLPHKKELIDRLEKDILGT